MELAGEVYRPERPGAHPLLVGPGAWMSLATHEVTSARRLRALAAAGYVGASTARRVETVRAEEPLRRRAPGPYRPAHDGVERPFHNGSRRTHRMRRPISTLRSPGPNGPPGGFP
ncbi:hypothetical protein [Streptomyces lavendofoliae]|uniref:hypothetical protein n=1 Tax=Streptomyces lavendofoliae TaxID=67314 RepID=UPI00167BBABB|nr:hypothetical protein [Streptomyces lavendofoliae]